MINRLRGMRFYSAGPMEFTSHSKELDWRNRLQRFLESRGGIFLSPLDKPSKEIVEDENFQREMCEWRSTEQYDKVAEQMKDIVRLDLRMVDVVDCVIAHIDVNVHTCGTYDEIFMARNERKPVLIYCSSGKRKCPLWLFGTFPHEHIFNSLDEVEAYLHKIDTADCVRGEKRWLFFDQSRMH